MNPQEKEIDGIPYEKYWEGEQIWKPVDRGPHALVCTCGCRTFEVFYPEPYYTNVRCTYCGWEETVHSG
jgi:hypothetical protein